MCPLEMNNYDTLAENPVTGNFEIATHLDLFCLSSKYLRYFIRVEECEKTGIMFLLSNYTQNGKAGKGLDDAEKIYNLWAAMPLCIRGLKTDGTSIRMLHWTFLLLFCSNNVVCIGLSNSFG